MTQWGLDTLFNPAKRHMDEEKRRLQSTRAEVGDASGGKRIDLESGKVTIRRGGKADEEAAAAEADETSTAEASTAEASTAEASTDEADASTAEDGTEARQESGAEADDAAPGDTAETAD